MIPPEKSDAGLLAYEQVQAFAALRRRRLPLLYVFFPLLLIAAAAVAWHYRAPGLAGLCVTAAVGQALVEIWSWRRLRARDAVNRALLAQLQAEYGENLPWLEVERQMARLRQIERERDASPGG